MRLKTRHIFLILATMWLAAGCRSTAPSRATGTPAGPSTSSVVTLNVSAAASLTEAFAEIGAQFEETHSGVKVVFNFAGSQQLAQQILEGAPEDVFASANQKQMDAVISSGLISADTVEPFAHNRLVIIYPKDNPAKITALQDLAKTGLRLVLAAKEVPVGQYSLDFLDLASQDPSLGPDYQQAVLKNVVSYEENVKAVLAKVELGEADGGIVYTSDLGNVIAAQGDAQVGKLEIPDALNVIATYPIAPILGSEHEALSKEFIQFVLSSEGQAILGKYGFLPVEK